MYLLSFSHLVSSSAFVADRTWYSKIPAVPLDSTVTPAIVSVDLMPAAAHPQPNCGLPPDVRLWNRGAVCASSVSNIAGAHSAIPVGLAGTGTIQANSFGPGLKCVRRTTCTVLPSVTSTASCRGEATIFVDLPTRTGTMQPSPEAIAAAPVRTAATMQHVSLADI